ncbi:acetylxylan esterase [Micromonospora sp. NPDC051006]|uniref:acetylxylan esterase n=1 Tax=Micromonospora sp. NPDC051006 TaxID=3364283 RepID=UPI00379D60E2
MLTTAPFLCDVQRAVALTDAAAYGEITRYLAVHREAEAAARHTLSYVDGVTGVARPASAALARLGAATGCGIRATLTLLGAFML